MKPSMSEVVVDQDSEHLLTSGAKWYVWKQDRHSTWYVVRTVRVDGRPTTEYLHRLVISAPPLAQVDHINGNGMDNRACNLRLADHAQNAWNSKQRNSAAGFTGVTFHEKCGRFSARIRHRGARLHLGMFASAIDAYSEYCRAVSRLRGEFGRVNGASK